jgi:hypothetical protein
MFFAWIHKAIPLGPKKVFTVTRPTLFFHPDPKLFYWKIKIFQNICLPLKEFNLLLFNK